MYGEHMSIKCKIPINQDYLSNEEESDEVVKLTSPKYPVLLRFLPYQ